MSRLKLLPPDRLPPPERLAPPEPNPEANEALVHVRQRSRANLKDIVWVAVGLAIILVVGMIYENGHETERRAAQRQAEIAAATAPALPPPGYDANSRYPSAAEVEAEQAARQARALVADNQAQNASDPMLNPKAAAGPAAMPLPTNPKPFSDPGFGTAYPNQPAPGQPVAPAPAGPPH